MANHGLIRTWILGFSCLAAALPGCTSFSPFPKMGHSKTSAADARYAKAKSKLNDPKKLYLSYAKWQEHIGNLTEARESYEQVLAEEPKSTDAILGLARLDQLAGRTKPAEQRYMNALRSNPNDPQVLDAVGQYYADQERWKESVELLTNAMKSAPADKTIRYHLAVALTKSGDVEAAKPHFVKTVGDAESHYNIGLILYEQGKLESSEQQFLQAVIKKPELSQAQYWLDEVRREQEAKLMLAGSTDVGSRFEALAPAPRQNDTNTLAANANSRNGQHSTVAPISTTRPTQPVDQLQRSAFDGPAEPKTADNTPPLTPATMTPAQLEQWRNQAR